MKKKIIDIINWFGSLNKYLSRKGVYEFLESELEKIEQGDLVLSVGSGGQVGDRIKAKAKAVGATVEETDIDPARKPDFVADICEWNAPNKYDQIFMLEVLEHTHNPQAAIENLFISLKPKGRLSLSVPFVFPIHDSPYDFFRFTEHGLKLLFKPYENLVVKQRNSWAQAITVLIGRTAHSDGSKLYLFSPLFVILALLIYPIATVIGKLLPARFLTTGYVLSANKPK